MIKNKIAAVFFVLFVVGISIVRAKADDIINQPIFSGSQSENYGSFAATIGIASGTISEFGTTTAAVGDAMREYLGWECGPGFENYGIPWWCNHYIQLSVATTTMLGTSTRAYVFQNPHQTVDGDVQLFYVDFYGGSPDFMGFGTSANTTPNLSWTWTCGPYCRGGGTLGGTSNDFVPYFEMGPQADPPGILSLTQSIPGGGAVQEGGTVPGNSVSFSAVLTSEVGDPLVLQVEVEAIGTPFTGFPTVSSTAEVSGGATSVVVKDLTDGGYHWAARTVDASTSESSPWTYFSPEGTAADFTVQTPKEPVVFIPGIVGSRLSRAANGKEVWPDVASMLMSPSDDYLDDLALASDGSQVSGREMAASSVIDKESVLGISASFYGNILQALVADGYSSGTTLFAFPYDWRLDIKHAAAALADTIAAARAASPDGKISIVAHSMGGLIAKEYLGGLTDVSFVDKLVLLGAPQLGSPSAFKYLNYGDNLGFQIPIVNLDILNHGEVKKIAQNMPSIYDLLPSRMYVQDNGGYVQDFRNGSSAVLGFDAMDQLMLANPADHRNAGLLAAADVLHGALDAAPVNAPSIYNIAGCAEPTVSGYRIYDNGVVDITRTDGDGVVPLVSAMDRSNGAKNYFISGGATGISHVDLVSDTRAISLIMAILDGKVSSFALPDGFSTSLDSCFPSTPLGASGGDSVEFSAHGAAGLTVKDNAGSFTGLNVSGTINLGIPDSTYEAIGDNYFITVPAGGDYQVITESSSSDALVVKATGYNGDSVTQTATYVASSTVSEGQENNVGTTTATLDFSGFDSSENMDVTQSGTASSSSDDTGNSSTTLFIAPIVASSSSDVTPPTITVAGISDPVLMGSTSTISFSASDADSGIALLSASLNGVPVASGDVITFDRIGSNVFRIEAIDNAGNPAVKEIDFTVSVPESASSTVGFSPKETSFSPVADTYIDANAPDINHGADQLLRLRARGKNRALIRFDQSAIKNAIGSSTIVSARLAFPVVKNWKNWTMPGLLALHRVTAAWTEVGATWNTENSTDGTPWVVAPSATTTISNDVTSTLSFDVTNDVAAFLNGTENDGWILQKADECSPGVIDFGSRESNSSPTLTITYE